MTLSKSQDLRDQPLTHRQAQRARVLVVEDHEDTRFMIKTLLKMRGLDVVEAENGEEAVDVARRECPDLILMDGSLPLLDGLAAMRRIRELASLRHVPVIFLSGHAEPAFRAVALEAGCNDYLIKPVDLDRLDSTLEKYLFQKE